MRHINEFLFICSEADTREELLTGFGRLLEQYNFKFFIFFKRSQDDVDDLGTPLGEKLPEGWRDYYHSRKYPLIDPTRKMLASSHRPFRWQNSVGPFKPTAYRKRIARLFQDSARYGMTDGYVFPIHGRGGLLGSVWIAGEPGDMAPSELALFDAAARATFWRLLELSQDDAATLDMPLPPEIRLTQREMDILILLSKGMTSPEMGKELSISSHTVDWYINGIQRKLHARNRQHAIALAFRYGLIS
ncbi:LuxR family transcriptional regulator [Rhizobium sp. CG4]|jgi:LuxR family transcriptional regulator|uniref:helix-turn-helix transcriptional regulator n=1 Tax=Rhizobium/Agrobacterium group TaxID=227290 RepID=UPI002033CA5E|nr:LuxR family transcriptional regulator [Rhizobium sp. CG4]MCM2456922.1 LuxR family transcriptional regulator [Rhizobium sp. CG4]